MEIDGKPSKLGVELKQTIKGFWYVGSLKVNADDAQELESLLLMVSKKASEHVQRLNSLDKEPDKILDKKEEIILNQDEQKLFQNLRELRFLLAKKEGVPPYIIFHDSVLKRLAKEKPQNTGDLIIIIGEKRFEKYGAIINELLGKFG